MLFLTKLLPRVPKTPLQFVYGGVKKLSSVSNDGLVYENLEDTDKGIVVFSFNRPKVRNALSISFVNDLNNALSKIAADKSARVLILRSLVPKIFCAGADLKERLAIPEEQIAPLVADLRNLMNRVQNTPVPVIGALDGAALGGGLEMALACDIRVASSDAKMGLVETSLAIFPGAGGTQRLPRLINPSVAKELIFTSRVIDGTVAYNLGIVNHVVPQNSSGDAAFLKSLELAREILPNGPTGIRMVKQAINKGIQVDLSSGLAIEEAYYSNIIPTKDRIEGLKAFKEKRKPKYTGN